jgi:chain length determinant protein EpsF
MDLSQFLRLLRARRGLFWSIFGFFLVTATALTWVLPKTYLGEVQVIVDSKNSDPITGLVMPELLQSANMATQMDVIASHNVALKVVDALHLTDQPDLQEEFRDEVDGRGAFRDWLAEKLLNHLTVKPSRQSNMITIRFAALDAEFAAETANEFANAYIQTSMELVADPAKRQSDWFGSQLKTLQQSLETSQRRLSEYQKKEDIVGTDDRLDVETAKLAELTGQLVSAQGAMYDAQTRLKQLNQALTQNQLDELPDILGNPLLQSMKMDLARAQANFAETAQRYDRNHPQYISAAAQVATLQSKFEHELASAKGSISQTADIGVKRVGELQRAVDAQKNRILDWKRRHDTLDVLKHDVDTAEHALDAASQRASEVKLQGQLDQSNIAILNPAIAAVKPARPKLWLDILVGFVLGLVFGTAAVVVAELRNRRIRSREDLLLAGGFVVLAELPHITADRWFGRIRARKHARLALEAKPA